MKLIDKLKNALFEEEYVEVEEKPKKKISKKESPKVKEEKPIAKKIVPPERKEVKITHHEDKEQKEKDELDLLVEETNKKNERHFPLVSDNEFREEKEIEEVEEKPLQKEKKRTKKENTPPTRYEEKSFKEQKRSKAYGIEDIGIPEAKYGSYEKKEERGYFKPSPIISPIYGILDKNYTKEEIAAKKEVRLTGAYAKENLDLDEVRERAFGDHIENIGQDSDLEQYDIEEESLIDNDLLDLSEEKPEVKKVTVGDAEEYFEDLGLEYNVDYKDASKEKKVGRRYQEEISNENQEIKEDKSIEEEKEEKPVEKEISSSDEDNLFDLIDSMYEKE